MSPFTELDEENLVDEEEIQALFEELDQLKIVISRLKPSGTWWFFSMTCKTSSTRTFLNNFY